MGDGAFFAALNEGKPAAQGGWGAIESSWDAVRFDAALAAAPGMEERAKRSSSGLPATPRTAPSCAARSEWWRSSSSGSIPIGLPYRQLRPSRTRSPVISIGAHRAHRALEAMLAAWVN